jgi:dienelactone hydrolase
MKLHWLSAAAILVAGSSLSGAPLDDYFKGETKRLSDRCLPQGMTLQQWKSARPERVRELREMLGLDPLPEKSDLKATVTGKLDGGDFTVEKLHFQSLPQLYVTANLYLPKKIEKPAPAILYVCGHALVETNGVSYGNKVAYQHHGIWFARNGYVCLVIDTIELGEIRGEHHGTYNRGMWWWNSRGYTPAGVEAWNSIRALDYLQSRPEVDRERLGVTGRSGGGAYSWWLAALDERIKAACPVAGITDLQNHVVDGTVEGHCDCMFMVNTYRWDYAMVAALVAPRPLLICNSDKDSIFPLDGVERVHQKVAGIYKLYGATNNLGLLITEGPHKDTQDLQVPVFRWFNRHLKHEDPLIEMAAKPQFTGQQLRVFDQIPDDERTSKIHDTFVATAELRANPDLKARKEELIPLLKEHVFRGWPEGEPSLRKMTVKEHPSSREGVVVREIRGESQEDTPVLLYFMGSEQPGTAQLAISATQEPTPLTKYFPGALPGNAAILFARGLSSDSPLEPEKKQVQLRRRYMLLGQTLDSMRVWDIRCAIRYLAGKGYKVELTASGEMAVNALYAALFEPGVSKLTLSQLPETEMGGPDYLNVLRFTYIPEVLRLVSLDREVIVGGGGEPKK